MKSYYKYLIIAIVIVGFLYLVSKTDKVEAEQSFFTRIQTNVSTTSPQFITPGTSTTTLAFPSHDVDEVDVFVQLYASSSATTLNLSHEYSNNNIDWYVASSSTMAGSANASTTRTVIRRPSHASNYQRVVFTLPIGSTNGTLWAEATLKRNAN